MVDASPAIDPISVENIKLNCRTSVQFLVPEMGHAISKSIINCLTPSKSSFDNVSLNRDSMSAIFEAFRSTFGFVRRNSTSLKASPNFCLPLSTSFSIFIFIFSMCSSINTSARYLFFESLLSIKGSLKASTWPEAFQIVGCIKMEESMPTILVCI